MSPQETWSGARPIVHPKFGRKPFDPSRPRLDATSHLRLGALPAPPSADWLSRVTNWGMLGNDQAGDCVEAEVCHEVEARTAYTGTPFVATTAEAIGMYSAITGYNPNNPNSDQGTSMADAMAYWQKTGVAGHKIIAYAGVDISNPQAIQAAVAVFGAVALGFNCPRSALTQFNSGQPWDVVANDGGIAGGHAVELGWYNASASMYEVVTWGAVQKMTAAFMAKYTEEAWVVITQDWINANGSDPAGINLYALGQDFAALTGQPNPIPAPPVPPQPPVPPIPPVPPATADVTLAAAMRAWLKARNL